MNYLRKEKEKLNRRNKQNKNKENFFIIILYTKIEDSVTKKKAEDKSVLLV